MHPHKHMKRTKKSKGFTLVELLVIISIIGLLSSIIFVMTTKARVDARDAAKIQNLNTMAQALNLYYSDTGQCPSIGTEPQSSNGWNSAYSDRDWPFNGDELKTKLAPYMGTLPKTTNSSYANTYGYHYAFNDATLSYLWSGPPLQEFCLSLPKGNCFVDVPLEKASNLPQNSMFSSVANGGYYMIPVGTFKLDAGGC